MMKARIYISGQASSVFAIKRHLHGYSSKKDGRFNSVYYYYDTVGAAKKDLVSAWSEIKDCEYPSDRDGMGYKRESLQYDAATAVIERSNEY